jgi:hypothetical protein
MLRRLRAMLARLLWDVIYEYAADQGWLAEYPLR